MLTAELTPDVTEVLSKFRGDPQHAAGLAEFLGFENIHSPLDQLGRNRRSALKNFFHSPIGDGFGVDQLYRVGNVDAAPASVGLWIAVLTNWGHRSSDRDRSRRRVARAMVQQTSDRRALVLLVPPLGDRRDEAELVFPRTSVGESTHSSVSSIRTHLDLKNPTRFHRDFLRDLRIPPRATLIDISRLWERQFSVERVTTRFYQEYAEVRNRIADALLSHNPDHSVVAELTEKDARAWATRQTGRVLFLWFLQAKRWLGEPGGEGSPTYLVDLWHRRKQAAEGNYFSGMLIPLFFDAMATGSSSAGQNPLLGYVPYLNGGLFRPNALEDRIRDSGEVSLPDDVFDPDKDETLLALLSRYRFTTRESTPDDQSVDPDPELLGRVFENLYQGDERHDTGTYYTPREIVHFMCRQALDGYLRDTTGVEQDTLDLLRETASGSRDESPQTEITVPDGLVDALETVRVCDPAVGSGAFLLGAIQEIIQLRRGILFSELDYVDPDKLYDIVSDWKRRTIENSLYGVDTNPAAVEICRLRLWLSMVLDMAEPPPANSNWALPNLDFRIVAGDSLVDRVGELTFMESWPPVEGLTMDMEVKNSVQGIERRIVQRKAEFDRTHRDPRRLRELRDTIARDQSEIIRVQLEHGLKQARANLTRLKRAKKTAKKALRDSQTHFDQLKALLRQIETSDFALVQKPFLWPVAFPEILRDGDPNSGFDIVLANPPYVRQEKLDAEDQKSYEQGYPHVYAGTADVLVFFYARAIQILNPDGWLSFITSNKFMRAGYGEGIRVHLPDSLRIHRIIDFGDLPLFYANGEVINAYPAVLVGSRSDHVNGHALNVADLTYPIRKEILDAGLKVNSENVRSVLENLEDLLSRTEVKEFPQVLLKKEGWVLEDPSLIRLFERLMNSGTPLGEYVGDRINRGITTGLNEAFVINQQKRDDLIAEDPNSEQIIKPWLRGKDIERWHADSSGLYLIAVQNSGDAGTHNVWAGAESEDHARNQFRDAYPAIYEHLRWFESKLRRRQDQGRFWWELRPCSYYHEFAAPKTIWKKTSFSPAFSYDSSGSYLSNTLHYISGADSWLAGVMNSSIMEFLMVLSINLLRGGYIELTPTRIEPLPVPDLQEDTRAELQELVVNIGNGTQSQDQINAIEKQIDYILFHAYRVPVLQRKLVLDRLCERREALGVEVEPEWRRLNSLRATSGAWKGSTDGEQLKRDIRASRQLNTRSVPRL